MVWGPFKAYIRGVLISAPPPPQKKYRDRKCRHAVDDLNAQIGRLEQEHKLQWTQTLLDDLDVKKNQLKLLEAHNPTKEILFSRQRLYEFRDKPGKHLAMLIQRNRAGVGRCARWMVLGQLVCRES